MQDYVIPFGKGRLALEASPEKVANGEAAVVITYGMGVYWAQKAAKEFKGQISIVDLRTLAPWDRNLVMEQSQLHGRVLVLTEESATPSFAGAVQGAIQSDCFESLDAPVLLMGAEDVPAIPLNSTLEQAMLPNADKVASKLRELLEY